MTAYKDVWINNPSVFRMYTIGQTPYFYENYIKDKKDVKIFSLNPYFTNDYILQKKGLIEIWCDLCGVKYDKELPELFFNQREVEYVQKMYIQNTNILLLQTNGGAQLDVKISWTRDLPLQTAQGVVNHFLNKYRIIHIRRDDQPQLMGVEQFKGGLRELFLLIRFSKKRLFIDSVCQHVASALGKPSTVTWVRTSPEVLGYSMHDNIVTSIEDEINTLSNSVLEPYGIYGNISECPFKEGTVLFDTDEIIQSLINQVDEVAIPKEEK